MQLERVAQSYSPTKNPFVSLGRVNAALVPLLGETHDAHRVEEMRPIVHIDDGLGS